METNSQRKEAEGPRERTFVKFLLLFLFPFEALAGSVALSWTPPVKNTDGTALTNLAGYIIEYGKDSHNLDKKIPVMQAGIRSYVVENLPNGTYYFAVRAVNTLNAESERSNMMSKVVGSAAPTDGSIVP